MVPANEQSKGQFIPLISLIILLMVTIGLIVLMVSVSSRTYSVPSPAFDTGRVAVSGWQSWVSLPDAITGVKSHWVAIRGFAVEEDLRVSLHDDEPILLLRCEGKEFDIIVHWGGQHVADTRTWFLTSEIPTVVRFDDATPIDAASAESADNRSMFIKDSDEFVEQLNDAGRVAVRITNYDEDQMTALFFIDGLHERWGDLPCVESVE